MLVMRGRRTLRLIAGTAVITGVFEIGFGGGIVEALQRTGSLRPLLLAHLADPALEFIRIEMAIAVVGERGESAVLEGQQRREGAFGRPCCVPGAGLRPHGLDAAAAEQAHDVDLMRRLAEQRAAALSRVELFRPARAVDEIRVVQRRDHAHAAELAAVDQFAAMQDRRVERMTVADDEMHVGRARRRDHLGGFGDRERDRLLDQNVLAGFRGQFHMRGVHLVRRRHIDHFDIRIGAQSFHVLVGPGAEILGKPRARHGARVGRRHQLDARVVRQGRQHHGEGTAETGHPEPQLAFLVHALIRLDKSAAFH